MISTDLARRQSVIWNHVLFFLKLYKLLELIHHSVQIVSEQMIWKCSEKPVCMLPISSVRKMFTNQSYFFKDFG